MNKNVQIGVFDSGVGGITIWQEIVNRLPHENTLYLADNINAPYGFKSKTKIIEYSIKNTQFLLSKGAKLIVVACNTATTNVIDILRHTFPNVPFIGVEPAIKPAALLSKNKRIAVLATYNTLHSNEFLEAVKKPYMDQVEVFPITGMGLVPLIEENKIYSYEMEQLITKYSQIMISEEIDYLVLGCTHYPYIKQQLQKALPTHIKIIDSGEAVARQTEVILKKNNLLNTQREIGQHQFYYNDPLRSIEAFVPQAHNIKLAFHEF